MFRWTARFLLVVMFAPVFGPLALARTAQPGAMHCMRQPVSAHPAMPCHQGMAQSKAGSESSEVEPSKNSFQATNSDDCCLSHRCCCCATTSEWAQAASSVVSLLNLQIESKHAMHSAMLWSSAISGNDSARAPPRG